MKDLQNNIAEIIPSQSEPTTLDDSSLGQPKRRSVIQKSVSRSLTTVYDRRYLNSNLYSTRDFYLFVEKNQKKKKEVIPTKKVE
jgi:hypothetical protein